MTEEEIGELYTHLAFQHESTLDTLIAKRLIDQELADGAREKFYTSLNEEKSWTYKKIGRYTKIIRNYM